MQNKIFGLTDHKLLKISNGNLELNEYFWDMSHNYKPSGSKELGMSQEFKFISKGDSQALLVFVPSGTVDIVRAIAAAAVTRDISKSNYAFVIASSYGYKEKLLAKSLFVYLVFSIDYIMVDGTVKKIRSENSFSKTQKSLETNGKKREKMGIMKDVLNFILEKEGTGITSIISKCNLNYNSALNLLNIMIEKDYLKTETIDLKKTYIMTNKGKFILEAIADFEI